MYNIGLHRIEDERRKKIREMENPLQFDWRKRISKWMPIEGIRVLFQQKLMYAISLV